MTKVVQSISKFAKERDIFSDDYFKNGGFYINSENVSVNNENITKESLPINASGYVKFATFL